MTMLAAGITQKGDGRRRPSLRAAMGSRSASFSDGRGHRQK